MTSRPVLVPFGVLWAVCGFLITTGPLPPEAAAAIAVRAVGWLIAVTGVFALLTAVSRTLSTITLPPPGPGRARRLVAMAVLVTVAGGGLLWWGIGGGSRSVLCLGLVVLSVVPVLLMRASASARDRPPATS